MVDSGVPVPFVPTKNSANGTPTNKRKRTSSETDSGIYFFLNLHQKVY